jgi:flagellar biosynthesis/type III secretory pathway protein FliH
MKRLTKEQLTKINSDMPSEAKYGEVFEGIADAQLAQDQQACEAAVDRAWKQGYEEGIKPAEEMASINLKLKADCEARIREIFEDIENHLTQLVSNNIYDHVFIVQEVWDELKSEYLSKGESDVCGNENTEL